MAKPRRARGSREVFDPARRATQLHQRKKEKALPNIGKGQVNPRKLPQPHNPNSRAAKSWRRNYASLITHRARKEKSAWSYLRGGDWNTWTATLKGAQPPGGDAEKGGGNGKSSFKYKKKRSAKQLQGARSWHSAMWWSGGEVVEL